MNPNKIFYTPDKLKDKTTKLKPQILKSTSDCLMPIWFLMNIKIKLI